MTESIDVKDFIKRKKQEYILKNNGEIDPMLEYIRADEYGRRIHRSSQVVNRMCRDGEIKGAVKSGRFWFIPVEEKVSEEYRELLQENARLKEQIRMITEILKVSVVTI